MKKTSLTYYSRADEVEIYATCYEPEASCLVDGKPRAILQVVHGMAECMDNYEELAEFFTGKGFLVVGEDHLGHGRTAAHGGIAGYFCKDNTVNILSRDVHRLKKMIQKQYPGIPCFIIGFGMGALILDDYVAWYRGGIDGAIFMGSSGSAVAGLTGLGILSQKMLKGDSSPCKSLHQKVFEKYLPDATCDYVYTVNVFQTLLQWNKQAFFAGKHELLAKDFPILFQSGKQDPVGDFGASVMKCVENFREFGLKNVEAILYEQSGHRLLQGPEKEKVMEDLCNFVLEHCPKGEK